MIDVFGDKSGGDLMEVTPVDCGVMVHILVI